MKSFGNVVPTKVVWPICTTEKCLEEDLRVFLGQAFVLFHRDVKTVRRNAHVGAGISLLPCYEMPKTRSVIFTPLDSIQSIAASDLDITACCF